MQHIVCVRLRAHALMGRFLYKDLRPGGGHRQRWPGQGCPGRRSPLLRVRALRRCSSSSRPTAYTPVFGDDPPAETEITRFLYGGHSAFYDRWNGDIHLPPRGSFRGSDTRTPVQSFYATALHELGPWSGAEARLERSFGKRFRRRCLCGRGAGGGVFCRVQMRRARITNELRPDHVQYVGHWLRIMKADNRALFTAAAAASTAVR